MSTLLWESFGAIRAALPGQTYILLLTFLVLLGWYSVAPFRFFKRLGIPGPMPLPFIGTFFHYRKGLFNFDVECYKKYGDIWGIFDGRKPVLCIMEPDLIKTILIKEFYTVFTNRRDFGLNGPFQDSVLLVPDEQWKRIRSVLSPTFTTGRLKEMCPIIHRYAQNLVKYAEKKSKLGGVDMKDVFGSYSMDVVTSTSFSVDIDTINNPKDPFVTNVKKLVDFSFFDPTLLLIVLFPIFIPILEKLNYSFFPREVNEFFMAVVSKMKAKRQRGVHTDRVDFLQMMVDSQVTGTITEQENNSDNPTYKALTDAEILAQAFTFIFAGYETTSNTLLYTAYCLAVHPDVQKKLQQEIDEAFPNKAPPTYDGVMHLEYLEMVICETLRIYPPAPRVERVCKKDVKLNGVTIPKDTVIVIPAYALHHDPKYWPEPEEFRPERFNKEARETLNPAVYLPFGMGPRNCIGMRFAQLMIKMALVSILQHVTLVPCAETPIPLELDVKGPMHPKKPVILKFVLREDVDSQE